MAEHYKNHINRQEGKRPIVHVWYTADDSACMSPRDFAHGVVRHVLSHNPSSRYWRGTWSTFVMILHKFFPPSIYVSVLAKLGTITAT